MAKPQSSGPVNPSHKYVWDDANARWEADDGTILPGGAFAPSSTIGNGQKTVSSAGTAEVLAASTAVETVVITALSGNTGTIYVGDSGVDSTNGYELTAGVGVSLAIDNLNLIYIDTSVSTEGVSYLYVA